MQLSRSLRARCARPAALAAGLAVLGAGGVARAEVVSFETAHTIYYESPTRTNMFVYTPGGELSAKPTEWLGVRAGYEADIVSGASVSTKAGSAYQANNPAADVISTASVKDIRHSGRGGLSLKKGDVTATGNYAYSTENDYRSHSFNVAIRTEAYDHNTQFEISYARNFDRVCDRTQGVNDPPTRFRALESSDGCFKSDPLRTQRDLGVDGFQGSWSQAWTPIFVTQLVYTAQVTNGFQSSPYRSVIIGQGLRAQEHHPENRARQALALRMNLYLRPIKAAVRVGVRAYDDTWDIKSGTIDAELEKYVLPPLRAALRGRLYKQTGALFWSDDYTGGDRPLGPKGQYFTGDRELSPFWSWSAGARVTYLKYRSSEGRILGFLESFRAGGSFDVIGFDYAEYTLGGVPVGSARAYVGGVDLGLAF